MSNSLAHYLRNIEIGKGNIVPIITERSQYYVIESLAIMKSGAAYLPVDPYKLMNNDEISKFADLINEDEIYRLYGREDLISTNIKPRAENRFYHDFLMEVTEGKDFYSLHLLYKSSVFDKN